MGLLFGFHPFGNAANTAISYVFAFAFTGSLGENTPLAVFALVSNEQIARAKRKARKNQKQKTKQLFHNTLRPFYNILSYKIYFVKKRSEIAKLLFWIKGCPAA
jgi:hypothetical protein